MVAKKLKKVGGGKSPMCTHGSDSTTLHIVTEKSEWTRLNIHRAMVLSILHFNEPNTRHYKRDYCGMLLVVTHSHNHEKSSNIIIGY